MMSFYHEGSKVRFATGCLRERARDWWEEVDYALGAPTIEVMTLPDFMTNIRAEFALAVEVKQLAKEFLNMRQTTETMAEITAKLRERDLFVP